MANYRRVWPTGSLGERFGTLGMNGRTLGEVVAGVRRDAPSDSAPLVSGGQDGQPTNSDAGFDDLWK